MLEYRNIEDNTVYFQVRGLSKLIKTVLFNKIKVYNI